MAAHDPTLRRRQRQVSGDQAAESAIFTATEQLLVDHSLHALSVEQILTEAGLSRASFYHYFSSKYEVVAALLRRIFGELFSETHEQLEAPWNGSAAALRDSLRIGMATWDSHQAVIHATLENLHAEPVLRATFDTITAPFVDALTAQIEQERAAGRARDGAGAGVIAAMLVKTATRIFYVGSTGHDPRVATVEQRLDAIVAVSMAAIYGSAAG